MSFIFGDLLNDTLIGSTGNNILFGFAGDDSLIGGTGNNTFFGDQGNDTLIGGSGKDLLIGGADDDILFAGDGEDTLFAGDGNNILTGGAGADVFAIGFSSSTGEDTITDFKIGVDKIGISSEIDVNELQFFTVPNTGENSSGGVIRIVWQKENERAVLLANLLYEGEAPTLNTDTDFQVNVNPVTSLLEFNAPSYTLNENGIPASTITINRIGDATAEVGATINLSGGTATSSLDYISTPIPVKFASGETSKTVTIPIINDTEVEGLETVNLTLNNPTGGVRIGEQNTATVTIVDDDISLQFSDSTFTVKEDGTAISAVTLTRIGVADVPVSVNLTLQDGTAKAPQDYDNTPIIVNFAAGETSKIVNIPIFQDNFVEGSETINLALENAIGATVGSQSTALLTVLDNNVSLQFSAPTFSENEDGTSAETITVIRTGTLDTEVSATITLTNGTATATQDYNNTPIQIKFAPGETSKNITVPIVNDTLVETSETINLTLGNPSQNTIIGSNNVAVLQIVDNDVAPPTPSPAPSPAPSPGTIEFSKGSFLVNEDGSYIVPITLTRSGGSNGIVSATIALSDGSATTGQDYNNTPITVTFGEGEISKTVNVPIVDDSLVEVAETVNLSLVNPTGGASLGTQNNATLTIARSDMSALLDFEGAGNLNRVKDYYNSKGISFSDNALAIMSSKALDALGRSDEFGGNFGTPPSGATALTYGEGNKIVMNVAGGFDSKLSFFYASPFRDHTVIIYDNFGGTGNILGSLPLPKTQPGDFPDAYSTFNQISLPFSGIARSVSFGDVPNKLVLDNILLG